MRQAGSRLNKRNRGLKKLKSSLISQSFSPLFLLLIIKYIDICGIKEFVLRWLNASNKKCVIVNDLLNDEGSMIISAIIVFAALFIIIKSVYTFFAFEDFWKSNTRDNGEKINIESYESDVGITFFVTYILPLMIDDVNTIRGFCIFTVLMSLITVLLQKSNLYYQNPVLTVMGYRAFRFAFVETAEQSLRDREFIGLTKGTRIDIRKPIKRRILEDEIVVVFEK